MFVIIYRHIRMYMQTPIKNNIITIFTVQISLAVTYIATMTALR